MRSTSRRLIGAALAFTALSMIAVGCSKSDSDGSSSSGGSSTTAASSATTLRVPQDYKTIQAAVDAAKTGNLVLVDKGVYKEAVDVTTDDIKAVAHPVLRHRLVTTFAGQSEGYTPDRVIDQLLEKVPVELNQRADKLARG